MSDLNSQNIRSDETYLIGLIHTVPEKPVTVLYQGGPWHGRRYPYDPRKREVIALELVGETATHATDHGPPWYQGTNTTAYHKTVRYTPKEWAKVWTIKNTTHRVREHKTVGVTWLGSKVQEEVRVRVDEEVTFRDRAIIMVADGWTGEPQVEEQDFHGREVISRKDIKEGLADKDTEKVVGLLEEVVSLLKEKP